MPPSDDTTELSEGRTRHPPNLRYGGALWPGGKLIVGDHCYTDPQCAVINAEMGWCVSGGQGLEIAYLKMACPEGPQERMRPIPKE